MCIVLCIHGALISMISINVLPLGYDMIWGLQLQISTSAATGEVLSSLSADEQAVECGEA